MLSLYVFNEKTYKIRYSDTFYVCGLLNSLDSRFLPLLWNEKTIR